MNYLEQAKKMFQNDIYATETTGIEIVEVKESYAKCILKVERKHMNAADSVMGGAIFTLADFAFAVASNAGNPLTVSLSSQINYLSAARGEQLIAEAVCVKAGRSTCFYEVKITDEQDSMVAIVTTTGFRKG